MKALFVWADGKREYYEVSYPPQPIWEIACPINSCGEVCCERVLFKRVRCPYGGVEYQEIAHDSDITDNKVNWLNKSIGYIERVLQDENTDYETMDRALRDIHFYLNMHKKDHGLPVLPPRKPTIRLEDNDE